MLSSDNQNNKNINELNNNLSEHKYNLYQQFFIVGVDPKLMFNIYKIDLKTCPEPYISPKVISKYPNDLYYINNPDMIIASHCFPNGIVNAIIDYDESNYEKNINYQTNFVFSLENQYPEDKNCSLRTNRIYYSCLLFYENVENYQECILYKKTIFNNYYKENINGFAEPKNKGILIPKVICLSSFSPYFEQSKIILESLKKYVDNFLYNKISKDNFNIYPIEKIIEGLIYNLPALPRSNFILKLNKETFEPSYIENKELDNGFINSENKKNNENNYDIIFNETPFNVEPKNVINYSILMKYFRIKEVFELVKFILLEEPILFFCEDINALTYIIEGLISLIYPMEYQYPVIAVLPEKNYSFISIYKHFIFGINYKYNEEIFQNKGITLDDKKYIIIVKLEKRFKNILNTEEDDKLQYSVITSILTDASKPLIKIEQDKICNMETASKSSNIEDDNMPEKRKILLPMHYFEKCAKKLEKGTYEKIKETMKIKNKKFLNLEEKENIFNNEIRKTFIYFFSCILLRYQSFCVKYERNISNFSLNDSNNRNNSNNVLDLALITIAKINNSTEEKDFDFLLERNIKLEEKYFLNKLKINDLFNCKNFIDDNDTPKLDRPFYRRFFETQIFFNFIKKKIFPQTIQDKLDVLYFDYKVNEKLTRGSRKIKVETKFFNDEIKNLSGEIKINSFKKGPSKTLNKFLSDKPKNCKNGIFYFQVIANKKKINDSNKNNGENNSEFETMDTGFGIISLHKVDEADSNIDDNSSNLNITGKVSNKDDVEDDDENNKTKFTFSYYVFPKLLNDGLFYKEKKTFEELGNEITWLNNKNNFDINNCKCLYNQFEKEANIFINKQIIQHNYKIYDYNINTLFKFKYTYEECISKLWLLYLAKTFDSISLSKKRYYFEEILMFLNDKKNHVDQDTILLLFNSINKYGDRNMNQELFMYIYKSNYINFLCLREKTKLQNNYVKYINSQNNNYNFESNRGSYSNVPEDIVTRVSDLNLEINKEKLNKKKNRKLLDFYIYSYCSPNIMENKDIDIEILEENVINLDKNLEIKENNNKVCRESLSFNIKDLFIYESERKYIELKCPKCLAVQDITVACFYCDDNNNKFQLTFNLVSPLALQKEPWFKNFNKLDISFVSKEYPDEYLSALFYFYELGFPCNFLLPKSLIEKELKKERATTYDNIEPIDDMLLNSKVFNKKLINSLYSPRIKKRDLSSKDRINLFDRNKSPKTSINSTKSPSPKKSAFAKKSKFSQFKNMERLNSKNVTFSCFKK